MICVTNNFDMWTFLILYILNTEKGLIIIQIISSEQVMDFKIYITSCLHINKFKLPSISNHNRARGEGVGLNSLTTFYTG